uniref:Dynein heavy chain 2, axonemal n=1 Tax=Magallana gigas TaxID=29159 RepID=K1QIW0_MAGGI
MLAELRRHNYVTPTNYLELVSGYKKLLFDKKNELGGAADKLRNGLSKIDDTRQKVEKMSIELEDAKTKVAQFQKQCDEYLVIIVQQKRKADEQQKADLAQHDLDEALPALQEAIAVRNSLCFDLFSLSESLFSEVNREVIYKQCVVQFSRL